ncbi:hypothetical protein [Staphylococcus americanisciuri]|uniref:Nuclear transport factor 2 family protein n=1 Tax=Staphylococcus americanisciuri TaxID=2973940 RepID=A0ABT2F3H0_9STAP|nr:hypothetical protein [Staphylococcus americanisciuri]MCS4486981.1 hypothetical protein [Staphylococcus americanisciuri]
MQNHIDMINKVTAIPTALYYAKDIVIEDPYDATLFKGAAVTYEGFHEKGDVLFLPQKAELIAPISTGHNHKAAMAFKLYAQVGDHHITIDIIETMAFNEEGDITDITAYWGKENVTLLD